MGWLHEYILTNYEAESTGERNRRLEQENEKLKQELEIKTKTIFLLEDSIKCNKIDYGRIKEENIWWNKQVTEYRQEIKKLEKNITNLEWQIDEEYYP